MRYTRLSELLWDMPSDEELEKLYTETQIRKSNQYRRCLRQKDLRILYLRANGWSYAKIGMELGMSGSAVRSKMSPIKMRLKKDLDLEIDIPGLFAE